MPLTWAQLIARTLWEPVDITRLQPWTSVFSGHSCIISGDFGTHSHSLSVASDLLSLSLATPASSHSLHLGAWDIQFSTLLSVIEDGSSQERQNTE